MLTSVNCNLCKKNDTKIIYESSIKDDANNNLGYLCTDTGHGEYFQLVECKNCGLKYSSPREDTSFLEDAYAKVKDEIYKEELNGRIRTFRENLKNIDKYIKKGKLIDVGCSIGAFLHLAQKCGWIANGIEPSEWCVQQCKKIFNIDVLKGTYKELKKFHQEFDVVTMWDVLEHLDDPLEALINCRNALKDGGILALSTVDIGSFYARILGKKWPWLMKMHIYYFDRKTIRQYLDKAGLELVELKKYKHIISINYLLYKLKKLSVPLYYLVKFFKFVFLFNNNIYVSFSLGDFMEVYAKKPLKY